MLREAARRTNAEKDKKACGQQATGATIDNKPEEN